MGEDAGSGELQGIIDGRLSQGEIETLLRRLPEGERAALILRIGDLLRRKTALSEIADSVSDSLSLDVLFPRLMQMVTETIGAERSTLFLHDPETDELFSRVMQGNSVGEVRFPARAGIAGAVFGTGQAEIVGDAYADSRFNRDVDRRTGFRTRDLLCVPIRNKRGEVIGVTQVLNKRGGVFDVEDQRLLESINLRAAAALENARLFEKVERQQREEALLLDLQSAIASEIHLDPLLDRIVKGATALLDADRGSLFLFDPGTGELYSRVAEKLGAREIRFPAHAGIAGECFVHARTVNIPDAYADSRFNPEVDRRTAYRTRSILCMPITTKDGTKVGVMEIMNKKTGPFGPADERRLRALCAQAAISLENARLFEEVSNARNYNENILRSMSNAVLTLDAAGRITKINQAAVRILRREEETLVGARPEALFAGRNAWVVTSLDKVRASGRVDTVVDCDLFVRDREAVSLNLTTVPLRDAGDSLIGFMLVMEDITREKRLKNTMARYMSKAVMDRLLEGGETALGGLDREVSVLFSDIRGFSAISERLGARETVALLNQYFTRMVDVVLEHNGILDKYIGDMIMAVFGSVLTSERDADNAVAVGNGMMRVLRELNEHRVRDRADPIRIGIGIATGHVVAGNIGSPKRVEYTVVGDRVNLAERLETTNKYYGTGILLCEDTARKLKQPATLRELDLIRVRGMTRPVAVYEALDHHTDATFPRRAEVLAAFGEGLHLYRQRDWSHAAKCFRAASMANEADRPSRIFLERCQQYLTSPPAENWDGVWAPVAA